MGSVWKKMNWVKRRWSGLKNWFRHRDGQVRHPDFKVLDVTQQVPKDLVDWGLQKLHVPDLWKETKGKGIRVGVIDTGACLNHPDLKTAIVASKDFTGKGTAEDGGGHGSHCAGIIGARENGMGCVGVAPECELYIAKALRDNGSGDFSYITAAVYWLMEQDVDIISMSLGGGYDDVPLHEALKEAAKSGIVLIAAAGNDGVSSLDDVDYPGRYAEVVAVGAIDANMNIAGYSSVGPQVDVLAPGSNVYSTYLNNSYALLSGTSMATPFVSGVVALVLAHAEKEGKNIRNVGVVHKLLMEHAIPGSGATMKYGIINPVEFFKSV